MARKLEEWFDDWALALQVRSGRADWPDIATDAGWEFWRDFRRGLARCGAHEAEADEASSVVCDAPGLYVSQYRPAIVEAIRAIQARALAEVPGVGGGEDPLRAAQRASADCPDCGGSGWAVRHVHAATLGRFRTANGDPAPVGSAISLPCGCDLGRLVARAAGHRLTVADYPSLRLGPVAWSRGPDNEFRHRPSAWDDDRRRPLAAGVAIRDAAQLRDYVGALAGPERASRPDRVSAAVRPDLAHAPADPVIVRELARTQVAPVPAAAEDLVIPEDDWTQWP